MKKRRKSGSLSKAKKSAKSALGKQGRNSSAPLRRQPPRLAWLNRSSTRRFDWNRDTGSVPRSAARCWIASAAMTTLRRRAKTPLAPRRGFPFSRCGDVSQVDIERR